MNNGSAIVIGTGSSNEAVVKKTQPLQDLKPESPSLFTPDLRKFLSVGLIERFEGLPDAGVGLESLADSKLPKPQVNVETPYQPTNEAHRRFRKQIA